jgi:hypothetical protein
MDNLGWCIIEDGNFRKDRGRVSLMERISFRIQPDPLEDISKLYGRFNTSIAGLDCGRKCAPFNPSGKPFCCDICHAVPAVYHEEWNYLKKNTDLWHSWRGDECADSDEAAHLQDEVPESMILLACKGPTHCQRSYRALSCRQFPFFPYVSSDYRFMGLAYEWEFEKQCWVISNLHKVAKSYRVQFIAIHDSLFAQRQDIFDNYAYHSERMRMRFMKERRRIPLLHRNGKDYLVSPKSGRMVHMDPNKFPRFSPYRVEK